MARSGSGGPPSPPRGSRACPRSGASTQEIGRTQPGKQRERDEEPADQPDRVLEQVPERPRGPVADERRPRAGSRTARSRPPSTGDREAEERRVLDVHVDPEDDAGPRAASPPSSRCRSSPSRSSSAASRARTAPARRRAARASRASAPAAARRRPRCSSTTRCPSPPRRARRRAARPALPARNMKNATVAKKSG